MESLDCASNALSSIDPLDGLTSLQYLDGSDNLLSGALDLTSISGLLGITFDFNQIDSLNVSGLPLTSVMIEYNNLASFDAQNFPGLINLLCGHNAISELDLSACHELYYFNCNDNLITGLNLANQSALVHLDCSNNQITSLNLQTLASIIELDCSHNGLTGLDLANLHTVSRI